MSREERKIAALMAQFERMEERARRTEEAANKDKEPKPAPKSMSKVPRAWIFEQRCFY